MIISHKHKFIFIKTKKTAGTSLEIALSKFCGPRDIITPFSRRHDNSADEALRRSLGYREPQNFLVPWSELSLRTLSRTIYFLNRPHKFIEHDFAKDVRVKIGDNIFSQYLKFAVMRNPFDRAVSTYFWNRHIGQASGSLFDFIKGNPATINVNWALCSDADHSLLLDEILCYENLKNGLGKLAGRLGISVDIFAEMRSIRAKGDIRPQHAKNYREVIDKKSRTLIELLCADEIEHFGYEF